MFAQPTSSNSEALRNEVARFAVRGLRSVFTGNRRTGLSLWMMLALLYGAIATTHAAESERAVHTIDGSFVRDWLVLGPFPSRDLETDFLASVGGEANVRPKEGDTFTAKDGKQMVWTRFRSTRDVIDFEQVFGSVEWCVIYAYCELKSDEPTETDARMNGTPGAVWVNGKSVGRAAARGYFDLPTAFPIQLAARRNSCLLKLRFEFEPPYAFAFQPLPSQRATADFHVTDAAGAPVPGAVIQLYGRGKFVTRLTTGASGQAEACLYPLTDSYDAQITFGEMGTWLNAISLRPGERRNFEAKLRPAISISGKVLAMDRSPQHSIVVQAQPISNEFIFNEAESPPSRSYSGFPAPPRINPRDDTKPAFAEPPSARRNVESLLPAPAFSQSVLSDTNGNFQFVNLRPGQYRVRAHGAHGYVYPEGEIRADASKPIAVEPGRTNDLVRFIFPEAKKAMWTVYPMRKGLAEINPSILHRTADGMLWIGTFQGTVHAFDGVEFKDVSSEIPQGYLRAIAHDASGTLWLGAQKGIGRVAGGQIHAEPFNDTLTRKEISTIETSPDGTVWFSTSSGLVKYDGKQFRRWSLKDGIPSNQVGGLLRTRDGALWMSTVHSLTRFDGTNFTEPVLLSGIRHMTADRLFQAKDGALWFCGHDFESGIYRYDGTTISRLGEEEGLICNVINDIAETSDGILWLATDRGLSRFDGTTILSFPLGFDMGGVQDISVDSDDVLWCAAFLQLFRFDPKGFVSMTQRDGLANKQKRTTSVFAIEPDGKGGYLIGSEWGGVFHMDETRDRLTQTDVLPTAYVRTIRRSSEGTFWFGTADGIYKQTAGQLERVLERNWIVGLNRDDQGHFWFGHGWVGGGVSRFDPRTGTVTSFTRADGLPDDSVWAIEPATGGGVLIGTSDGLAEFRDGKIKDVGKKLGIRFGVVSSLGRDPDGTLWIGGDVGGKRLKGTNLVSAVSTNVPTPEGVWCSVRTADGVTWTGTDKYGLLGYDGKATTMLDTRDGLAGNQVFCLTPDVDGSLLIGFLGDGLSRYRRTTTPPSMRLIEVKLEDHTFSDFAKLPATDIGKRVSVQYQEIDLKTHPEKRQFRYRVEGPSGETLFGGITKDRRFEWTPKKGGAYTFEVQAIDRDLNYSKPARLTFRATVPWYANAWITAPGGAVFVALFIWGFVVLALYRRKSREAGLWQERVRIARDLHDNLGAGLTHLAMVSDQVRQQAHQPHAIEILAGRLTDSARELTRTMGEIIWMTDPSKGTLRSFVSFLTSYAERFFSGTSLRLRFEIPADIPDVTLPDDLRRSLFLVIKEALNNVVKHAHASELRIQLQVAEQELHLSFEDNGRGFSKITVGTDCRGLVNMKERLRDLGGHLRIESVVGQGTRVVARVPLPLKKA
jgi:ligand-binding sensor domain-containing protein/two-component sensor histidine kinase